MTLRTAIAKFVALDEVNFLLTNRLPRRLVTTLVGRLSKIEQPLVARLSIRVWRFFSDLDLSDARETHFPSMHACFTRALRPGARTVTTDPAMLASPCDAIVGATGRIEDDIVFQLKGAPYRLSELLGDAALAASFRDGIYVTLRLTASMYHRFHAPHDCRVEEVRYLSGDTWNVNSAALKRVERLFCRNERAVLRLRLGEGGLPILLVPVAAILVAGIRLRFLDTAALLREGGPRRIACDVALEKGQEMGWFEHGSTIIAIAPASLALAATVVTGNRISQGEEILRLPPRDLGRHDPAGRCHGAETRAR